VALPTEPRVADNPRASRCGLWLGATRTGLIEYRTEPGVGVHRPHRCRPAFAGQWLGERLVAGVDEYQMNTFIFWPSGDRERQSRIFAEEVVPPARQALASATG